MSQDNQVISRNPRHVSSSKFMIKLLRHGVTGYPLDMDSYGWVEWSKFVDAVQKRFPALTEKVVRNIVETCPKHRFRLAPGKISAWYGHSLPVEEQDTPVIPPELLYHGTTNQAWATIQTEGLTGAKRKYVHLSENIDDAFLVGRRKKGETIVLVVQADDARKAGASFYDKGIVFVTEYISPEYLSISLKS